MPANRLKTGFQSNNVPRRAVQVFDFHNVLKNDGVAHNLNVAVQPTDGDVALALSKMDFRSNEAGRTVFWKSVDFRAVRIRFPVGPRQVAAGASS
jgi:hypothetical protein